MRIVTRPDFDGVVCAVILAAAENIVDPVKWVEPNDMQNRRVEVQPGDIVANLPYHDGCSLWFDHHYTNQVDTPFQGAFEIAPSAAGVVYRYYRNKKRLKRDLTELVSEADKIDSAALSLEEVRHPEKYPYILLSMTLSDSGATDEVYWNRLVELLKKYDIYQVMDDPVVKERCGATIDRNKKYKGILGEYTRLIRHVSVTDLRSFAKAPVGNRFLVYSIFPEAFVSVKIRHDNKDREKIILSVGRNIFNPGCRVNIGLLLSSFNGGGHRGAGGCAFHVSRAEGYIPEIIDMLLENKNNEIDV